MIKWLREMLLLNILLVPPMMLFPAICWSLALRSHADAALVCVFFGPLSAGFWILVYSQLSSVPWRRGAATTPPNPIAPAESTPQKVSTNCGGFATRKTASTVRSASGARSSSMRKGGVLNSRTRRTLSFHFRWCPSA